jgi:manganese transport protein
MAPILFGVALVAAGQSSTITGTLAGQIVMEGYLNLRIAPWLRRLITRLIAIIPAYIVILLYGEGETGALLVLSQVVLSLQLGFAVIPLIHFTSDKKTMGEFVISNWVKIAAWLIALIIVSLNVKLVVQEITGWLEDAGEYAWIVWVTAIPVCMLTFGLLLYITFKPVIDKRRGDRAPVPHGTAKVLEHINQPIYTRIAICIDFSRIDSLAIRSALAQGGKNAQYCLIHVVESAGAMIYENEIADLESSEDAAALNDYRLQMAEKGFSVEARVGYGSPKARIPELVNGFDADLLVMGAHGHQFLKDLIFGTTLDTVRHKINIPLLIVRER